MYDKSLQGRRHTCRLRNVGWKALTPAAAHQASAVAPQPTTHQPAAHQPAAPQSAAPRPAAARRLAVRANALTAALLLVTFFAGAQNYPNGLSVNSLNPRQDSLALARVRARLDSVRRAERRPVVALSLCGGGAKGAAEVGALQYIVNELHIPIDFIAGTSIGGLLGGCMAMGYSVDDLQEMYQTQNWDILLSDRTGQKYSSYARKNYKSTYQIGLPFHLPKAEMERRKAEGKRYDNDLHLGAKSKDPASFLNSLPSGYVNGFNVGNLFSSLSVGYQDSIDFCALPIPFICTTSDLVSCKAYNFSSGDICKAMRATMSIPGMFAPVRTDGMVLSDGGLQNNLPSDIAAAVGADYVIAIDISSAEADYSDIDNVGVVFSQLIEVSGREAYTRNAKIGDSYIRVNVDGYSSADFNREAIDTLLVRGYAAALADSVRLKAIAAACVPRDFNKSAAADTPERDFSTPGNIRGGTGAERTVGSSDSETFSVASPDPEPGGNYATSRKKATDIRKRKVQIASVTFRGLTEAEAEAVEMTAKMHPGDSVDALVLNRVSSALQATGNFEAVSFKLLGSSEPYDLVFDCRQGPVHRFGVGLRLDTQEWVAVALNLGLNVNKLSGSKYDISARIGSTRQNLKLRYIYDAPKAPTFNVDIGVNQSLGDVLMGFDGSGHLTSDVFDGTELSDCRARYWSTTARIYLSKLSWKYVDANIGFQNNFYQMGPSDLYRALQEIDKHTLTQADLAGVFANLSWRTLDEIYFANRGFDFRFTYQGDLFRIGYSDYRPVHIFSADLNGVIPLGGLVAIIPDFHHRSVLDDNPRTFVSHRNFVGGLLPGRFIDQQIAYVGCAKTFITTNHVSVLNLSVRTMAVRNLYVSAFGGVLHCSDSLPDYFTASSHQDFSAGAEVAYNSIAGPIKGSVFWSKFFGWGACLSAGFDF